MKHDVQRKLLFQLLFVLAAYRHLFMYFDIFMNIISRLLCRRFDPFCLFLVIVVIRHILLSDDMRWYKGIIVVILNVHLRICMLVLRMHDC